METRLPSGGQATGVLLLAGLNGLVKGGNVATVLESILGFRDDLLSQNSYHAVNKINEFYVAPMLTPPKFAWFRDNGPKPRFYNQQVGRDAETQCLDQRVQHQQQFHGCSAQLPDLGLRDGAFIL